jgi:uncharacterized protein (DUF1330 family)
VLDATAAAPIAPLIEAAVKAAGGRILNTAGGRIISTLGEPPKGVALREWDSLEQMQAYYNSAAYKNLPPSDKALKVIRLYAVEAAN